MKRLSGPIITRTKIDEAEKVFTKHFGDKAIFNRKGWEYILDKHKGHLPLKIRAASEATLIPAGNVMMVIENTDQIVLG